MNAFLFLFTAFFVYRAFKTFCELLTSITHVFHCDDRITIRYIYIDKLLCQGDMKNVESQVNIRTNIEDSRNHD